MPTALRTYNIFFWNSSPKGKLGGTTWIANWEPGSQSLLMLKATGINNFINFKFKQKCKQKK